MVGGTTVDVDLVLLATGDFLFWVVFCGEGVDVVVRADEDMVDVTSSGSDGYGVEYCRSFV